MKKLLTLLSSVLAIIICCCFSACSSEPLKADENTVIITASDFYFNFENKTLKDYMEHLQENKKFMFTVSNGMVTEINGKANTTKSFWMLYTSDAENSNKEWGMFEYENSVYGSATLGADALIVKEGCIYIWAYQTF